MTHTTLSQEQKQFFQDQGYIVLRGAGLDVCNACLTLAKQDLQSPSEPWELEAVLGYPGAPVSTDQPGGETVRRLLRATERHDLWRDWATSSTVGNWLRPLLNSASVYLNPNHHNCLMTKSPQYSSDTGWHQDIRYWNFEKPELVSVWFALGEESTENGGLMVIPGSHRSEFAAQQFDADRFFLETDENKAWLDKAEALHLNAGDILLFDARLLHRASRNYTDQTKLSLVFTYHGDGNGPLPGTRSANRPELPVG